MNGSLYPVAGLRAPVHRLGSTLRSTAVAAAVVLSVCPLPLGAQQRDGSYVELGATRPHVSPVESDFTLGGAPVEIDAGELTFPHLAIGRRLRHLDLELGYRKLGVARYRSADGAVEGDTHSNAIEVSARVPFVHRARLQLDVAVGVQIIRTIAEITAAPPGWPIAGGVNTWRTKPVIGVGATLGISDRWGVGLDYAPILGRLGTAEETGRYQQHVFGIDLRRSW